MLQAPTRCYSTLQTPRNPCLPFTLSYKNIQGTHLGVESAYVKDKSQKYSLTIERPRIMEHQKSTF